jgi:hypothetical protein
MCVYYELLPSVVVHTYKDTRLQNMDESSWKNMFCVHQYVSSLHTGHWRGSQHAHFFRSTFV